MRISFSTKKPQNKTLAQVVLVEQNDTKIEKAAGRTKLVVGIGKKSSFNRRKLILAARKIVSSAKTHKIKRLALDFAEIHSFVPKIKETDVAEVLATNFEMANYSFLIYKTPPKGGWNFVDDITIVGRISPEVKEAFSRGQIIGEEVNNTRTLANSPGGEMTPSILAENAKKSARGTKIKVKVLDEAQIRRLGMGGILGVARGSSEKPKFIIMEYWGGKKNDKPLILIGKGVTFDTGGLNLKPSDHIYEMHMDMSGGAAVIHAVVLAARLGLSKNVVGLIPAVENMPSGSSYRPGDILKTMSGKTIEVLNTDAEGRIVLADALDYAKKYEPKLVVDVATLTGAAAVALGQRASAVFTRDEKLEKLLRDLGEESGDYVWPLPMWEEYEEEIRGTFGDWANAGKNKYGGAIHGAVFLCQWAKDYPWAHIDIAPRMTAIEGEYLSKGAAGAPVRLLVKLMEKY